MASAAGRVSVKPTPVRSKALAFVNVSVSVEAMVSTTLEGEKL